MNESEEDKDTNHDDLHVKDGTLLAAAGMARCNQKGDQEPGGSEKVSFR